MENKIIVHHTNVFSIDGFWDKDICESIIKLAETANVFPKQETVLKQHSLEDNLNSRDDFKIFLDNQQIADSIYEYLRPYLKCIKYDLYKHSGIHSKLRIYKYIPGQEFKRHRDGGVSISQNEESFYSLLLYLNDNFDGGNTLFDTCEIKPKQGRVTFFPHILQHSGKLVTKGFKYVLRGNIIFKKITNS